MTALGYVPTLPEQFIDSLEDSGRWRDSGITHWHLWSRDERITSPHRFDRDVIAELAARGKPEFDPKAALRWVYRQHLEALTSSADPVAVATQRGWHTEADVRRSIAVAWELMTDRCRLRTPIGGGLEARKGRSLAVYADPQTADTCHRH